MSIIFVLIPIALIFIAAGIGAFFWAVKSEQFEDLDRQGVNILFDEKSSDKSKKQHDNDAI
ncbi:MULTISPECIES: cbb3-type cytochrome oxidase assembly protein CcoS [unclassified Agarivorans]|uniref:cbb3-type cytochrome oxidase assembly protein CcoS n=1 Tax=unclassified Agarivorans TaxID=2636026 RepID=UPI003D7E7C9A